jgi:hypothetical protein
MRPRNLILVFIFLDVHLLYCENSKHQAQVLSAALELNDGLTGLKSTDLGSAACISAKPVSMPPLCVPVDPQSVAHSLTPGNPSRFIALQIGIGAPWSELMTVKSYLKSTLASIVGLAVFPVALIMLLVRGKKAGRLIASPSQELSSCEEVIIDNALLPLRIRWTPTPSQCFAGRSPAVLSKRLKPVAEPGISVDRKTIKWLMKL